MFKSKINVILTIYGDVKFDHPPSWIFFPKGLAYDFGSKFQRSSKFVYGQIGPENDVCVYFNVKSKLF